MVFFQIYWIGGLIWAFLALSGIEIMRKQQEKNQKELSAISKIDSIRERFSVVGLIVFTVVTWPLSFIALIKAIFSK